MIHGYARMIQGGDRILGFHPEAPIFHDLAPTMRTHKLVEAVRGDQVEAYSVVKVGDNHGFLWYKHEHDKALAECAHFNEIFDEFYHCIPLALGGYFD